MDEVRTGQSRPLGPLDPVVCLDALIVKMRDKGVVQNRAVYVALGVTREGRKEVLGLWSSAHEGGKFWLQILTELKNRGVQDIFIAGVDGLKGFPPAIQTVYPQATVQLCMVPLVRASLNYVSWQDRKRMAADLKAIYRAATVDPAAQQLDLFRTGGDRKYPTIALLWQRHWKQIIPLSAFPPEIRRVIDTTKAVESLHRSVRKIMKTRGSFPSEEAALQLLYWALRNVTRKGGPLPSWKAARNHFALLGEARFPEPGVWTFFLGDEWTGIESWYK